MMSGGDDMAKNRLRNAAVKIGSAVGRIDGVAHKAALRAAQAAHVARQELIDLEKQVDALKRQLKKSAKRLRSALK
jgi:multidrug resistance efflux pump